MLDTAQSFLNSPRTDRAYLQPCADLMARSKKFAAIIWSDATEVAAGFGSNWEFDCAAKLTSPSFARASIAARLCLAACRSITDRGMAGTIWSPTIVLAF